MTDDINSLKNKGMLWNVLLENGSFAGISETKIDDVNRILNDVVEDVGGGGMDLMTANKRVLVEMTKRLGVLKSTPDPTAATTRHEIQKNRIDKMNDMAKKMSADMNQYTPKKPKSVRFSDDVDKLSPEIMESRLERAIAARKLDVLVTDVSGGETSVEPILPIKPSQPRSGVKLSNDGMYKDVVRMYNEIKDMYGDMSKMMKDLDR